MLYLKLLSSVENNKDIIGLIKKIEVTILTLATVQHITIKEGHVVIFINAIFSENLTVMISMHQIA